MTTCCKYSPELKKALSNAGDNRTEIEKVLKYYNDPKDSLKYKAACFLIENMIDQYYKDGKEISEFVSRISKNKNKSAFEIYSALDSTIQLNDLHITTTKDIEHVTSDYLIDNIENSFKAWELPWAKNLNFYDFCEYILPYKSSNEKPEIGRESLLNDYCWIVDSIKNKTNTIEACNLIIKDLHSWYNFVDHNFIVDVGFQLPYIMKAGDCYMASNMSMYPMKALGLPVVFDYVPAWANRSGRHNWNALIVDGKTKTFSIVDAMVGAYKIEFVGLERMKFKRSKVFRKTYSIQKNSLSNINKYKEEMPPQFQSSHFKDVSKEYLRVSDITLLFDRKCCLK